MAEPPVSAGVGLETVLKGLGPLVVGLLVVRVGGAAGRFLLGHVLQALFTVVVYYALWQAASEEQRASVVVCVDWLYQRGREGWLALQPWLDRWQAVWRWP